MNETGSTNQLTSGLETQSGRKNPYQKPAMRFERVFETQALTCGKVNPTQGSCHASRKNS